MQNDLVFDLGLHRGEDTGFYLAKGFRVVAVDANAELCADVADRLAEHVATGALTLVNRAVADQAGELTFYADSDSAWGTVNADWAARNRRLGSAQERRTATAITMAELLHEHGTPYFVKIDIEGMDLVALAGLGTVEDRPKYVSIESEKVSFRALRKEFELLTSLGYDAFKIVPQHRVSAQRLPDPPREGSYVPRRFALGSSGAFGAEAPGEWVDAEEAIERYRRVFLRYALTGDDPYVRSPRVRIALKALGVRAGWYDTHARRSSV